MRDPKLAHILVKFVPTILYLSENWYTYNVCDNSKVRAKGFTSIRSGTGICANFGDETSSDAKQNPLVRTMELSPLICVLIVRQYGWNKVSMLSKKLKIWKSCTGTRYNTGTRYQVPTTCTGCNNTP